MKTIVGVPLVAKESRLVLDHAEFGKRSCAMGLCQKVLLHATAGTANEFNATLSTTRRAHRSTPRIAFLDCSVYRLDDHKHGKQSVLVEEKLDDEKWRKWNTNNGYVEGMTQAPDLIEEQIAKAMKDIDLGMIEEGSEEEDSDDEPELGQGQYQQASTGKNEPVCFTPSEVSQAFSHYTYLATGRKRLVCDLQGVFDEAANVLRLSDPVIHYNSTSGRRQVHGRTDRGESGIGKFFATHREHCGYLCRLVNRRYYGRRKNRRGNNDAGRRQVVNHPGNG